MIVSLQTSDLHSPARKFDNDTSANKWNSITSQIIPSSRQFYKNMETGLLMKGGSWLVYKRQITDQWVVKANKL